MLPNLSASAATAAPAGDWQLQNTRASSVPGAPTLTDIGTGNAFTTATVAGVSNRTVLRYPKGDGLQASPITGLTAGSTYSIVLLYRPVTLTGYQRLLDFNNGAGDTGLYQLNGGLSAYPNASSASSTLLSTTKFNQVVLTRSSSNVVTAYVNKTKVIQFTDSGSAWRIPGPSIRFFKDNTSAGSTGEEGAGQVARIRVYRTALTSTDVSALDQIPNNTADLAVGLTGTPNPVLHGNLLAYTTTVTNNGGSPAAGTTTTLTLPTGSTFVGSSPSVGTCAAPASGKVTCSLGTLAIGAKPSVLVVVKAPTATGTITSTVTVSSTTTDPTTSNNSATASTTVR